MSQQNIWQGKPSHWVNANFFFICSLLFIGGLIFTDEVRSALFFTKHFGLSPAVAHGLLLLSILVAIGLKALEVEFHRYEITPEVFRETRGVFTQHVLETELYRIVDTSLFAPFELRVMGFANIIIKSSDATSPISVIKAIKNSESVRQRLRDQVEVMRREKKILEVT